METRLVAVLHRLRRGMHSNPVWQRAQPRLERSAKDFDQPSECTAWFELPTQMPLEASLVRHRFAR